MNRPKIISELDQNELLNEFRHTKFSKWGSMCLLRYIGVRVLDSCLIEPTATSEDIKSAVERFIQKIASDKILIRTDGGAEIGDYIRGGNSLPIGASIELLLHVKGLGRSSIIAPPTNRFSNTLALNLKLEARGVFAAEVLGPGFDISDINRGLIVPERAVIAREISWETYDPPHALLLKEFDHSNCIDELRRARLNRIGGELLPAIGIPCVGPAEDFAEEWLRSNGYLGLFDNRRPKSIRKSLREWYDLSFVVAKCYRRVHSWEYLVISASDLGDGKGLVFWEVVNPRKKFSQKY